MNRNSVANRTRAFLGPRRILGTGAIAKFNTLAIIFLMASVSRADQFIGHQNGREVVVHTNPIPVFLHRLVPPNYGRHVSAREYQAVRHPTQQSALINANRPRQSRSR